MRRQANLRVFMMLLLCLCISLRAFLAVRVQCLSLLYVHAHCHFFPICRARDLQHKKLQFVKYTVQQKSCVRILYVDNAYYGLRVTFNPVFFPRWDIAQQIFPKRSFRTAICDFVGSNQVFGAQNFLQSPFFAHYSRFLVDKSTAKRTRAWVHKLRNVCAFRLNRNTHAAFSCRYKLVHLSRRGRTFGHTTFSSRRFFYKV